MVPRVFTNLYLLGSKKEHKRDILKYVFPNEHIPVLPNFKKVKPPRFHVLCAAANFISTGKIGGNIRGMYSLPKPPTGKIGGNLRTICPLPVPPEDIKERSCVICNVRVRTGKGRQGFHEINTFNMGMRLYFSKAWLNGNLNEGDPFIPADENGRKLVVQTILLSLFCVNRVIVEYLNTQIGESLDYPTQIYIYYTGNPEENFYSVLLGYKMKGPTKFKIGELRKVLMDFDIDYGFGIQFINNFNQHEGLGAWDTPHMGLEPFATLNVENIKPLFEDNVYKLVTPTTRYSTVGRIDEGLYGLVLKLEEYKVPANIDQLPVRDFFKNEANRFAKEEEQRIKDDLSENAKEAKNANVESSNKKLEKTPRKSTKAVTKVTKSNPAVDKLKEKDKLFNDALLQAADSAATEQSGVDDGEV